MPDLKLFTFFVNLFLACINCWLLSRHHKLSQIVHLSQVESTNNIVVILNLIHLSNELRDELDQWLKFVANFPATFSNYFTEQISSVIKWKHLSGKLRMTEYLRISERIFVRKHYLEVVSFNFLVNHLCWDCGLMNWDVQWKPTNRRFRLGQLIVFLV